MIAIAVLRLVELEKFVIEGAGATGLAALISGQLNELKGKKLRNQCPFSDRTYIL